MSALEFDRETKSAAESFALAERLGKAAPAGTVFALCGELGAGKTLFAQGLARGLGVTEPVSSPTFTICKEYMGRLPFYHMDLYRLGDVDELWEAGVWDYLERDAVAAVEWADLFPETLAAASVCVRLQAELLADGEIRHIRISGPEWLKEALA